MFYSRNIRRVPGMKIIVQESNSNHVNKAFFKRLVEVVRWLSYQISTKTIEISNDGIISIFNVKINNISLDNALNYLNKAVIEHRSISTLFVNAHCLNLAYKDIEYRKILNDADLILPDGIGVKLASKIFNKRLIANLNGTDLYPYICRLASTNNASLFLLGGKEGIAESVAENSVLDNPNLKIAGTHHGYINIDDDEKICKLINESGAKIVMVAMGVPLQEKWIARNSNKLNQMMIFGVGGLFDFYSNRIPRAPIWMREVGLEWFWRMYQEPDRLWKRYVIGNPLFIWRVFKELRTNKRFERDICVIQNPINNFFKEVRIIFSTHWMNHGADVIKRILDIIISGTGILVLIPVFSLTALVIKLESNGPVFFKQIRVGKYGETFLMWKFRSMFVDAEARKEKLLNNNEMKDGVIFKLKDDPRITKAGKFIRKASIDELPQLWNVFIGNMTLVGPRPPIPSEVSEYSLEDRYRLDMKPGITCLWQISGRSLIPFKEQVQLDLKYIKTRNLFKDIKILIMTIPAVLMSRGAY